MGAEKYKKETQFYFAVMAYIYFHIYQHQQKHYFKFMLNCISHPIYMEVLI